MAVLELSRPRRFNAVAAAAVAAVSAALATVWYGLGVLSLPGLLALLATGALALIGAIAYVPGIFAVLAPCLMPIPLVGLLFPFELALGVFTAMVALHGLRWRPHAFRTLEPLEIATLALAGWAAFTGLWAPDTVFYLLGVRRLLLGCVTLWVIARGARLIPRTWYEMGLVGGAGALAASALAKLSSFGSHPFISRGEATNLGWGAANYIATLLLVLTPVVVVIAWRARPRAWKVAVVICLALVGLMEFVIASRAATILFVGGLLVQFSGGTRQRHRLALGIGFVLAVTALMLSPIGGALIERFQDPRDLGSMVVRLWYIREAWHRTLDHLPWGIGLGQGLVYPDHLQSVDPHNYWLVVSSELGLPGVLAWGTVLVLLWRRIGRMAKDPRWREEGRALQIAFWTSQLHSLVEPTFQGVHYQFVFYWVMGGTLALMPAGRPRIESHSAR